MKRALTANVVAITIAVFRAGSGAQPGPAHAQAAPDRKAAISTPTPP